MNSEAFTQFLVKAGRAGPREEPRVVRAVWHVVVRGTMWMLQDRRGVEAEDNPTVVKENGKYEVQYEEREAIHEFGMFKQVLKVPDFVKNNTVVLERLKQSPWTGKVLLDAPKKVRLMVKWVGKTVERKLISGTDYGAYHQRHDPSFPTVY